MRNNKIDPSIPRKMEYVLFEKLTNAPWQPGMRMETNIQQLAESIKKVGLLELPAIDENFQIIDGHRRITACMILGYKGCMCEILSQHDKEAKLFGVANIEKLTLDARQEVFVYLKGGQVKPRTLNAINLITRNYGNDTIIPAIAANKVNPVTLSSTISRITGYVDMRGMSYKQVTDWTLKHKAIYKVKRAIELSIPKRFLKDLIKKDMPVAIPTIAKSWDMTRRFMTTQED